jgi:hypothetical protein
MGWGNTGNTNVGDDGLMCVGWIQPCLMYLEDKGILSVTTESVVRYKGNL